MTEMSFWKVALIQDMAEKDHMAPNGHWRNLEFHRLLQVKSSDEKV